MTMNTLGWVLSLLGVGGVLAAAAILFPTATAAFALRVLEAAVSTFATLANWLINGLQAITLNKYAMFTFLVAIFVAGWSGDRFDFVRPLIPELFRSAPPPQTLNAPPVKRQAAPAKRVASSQPKQDWHCNAAPWLC